MNFIDQGFRGKLIPIVWFLSFMIIILVVSGFTPQFELLKGIAGYAPLHTFLETISIIVAMLVFSICWDSNAKQRAGNFLLLGCVFLAVALIDFLHLLSYPGMPDFITANNPEKAIDFWLVARLLAALGLLAVALLPWRPLYSVGIRWLGLAVTLLLVVIVAWIGLFYQELTPSTFVEGQGLTPFKVVSEYLLVALYVAAALRFFLNMRSPQSYDVVGLFAAVSLMAMSEVFFTLYSSVNDVFNLLGHVYKIIAYGFIYKSIFSDNVRAPYQRLKEANAALQISEERLAMVLEGSRQGFWDWNIETGKVQRNQRWAEMLGYTTIEDFDANTNTWTDGIHPDDRDAAWAAINDHLEGRSPSYEIEYRMLTKSGSFVWVLDQAKIVRRDAMGRPLRMCGTHTDISERKQAEQEKGYLQKQLQQAQKMESIGQLTGGIAHDFNNILAAIIGYSELSINRFASDTEGKLSQYLHEILHAGERGRDLVSKMLAFGRISPAELQAVDAVLLIKDVTKMLGSTLPSSLVLKINIADDVAPLLGDPAQLHQVVTNLVINAHHAVGERGKIELGLGGVQQLEGVCSSCHQPFSGEFIEISVRDNGQGIPNKQIEHIFEPFFSTKEIGKGSGMGLSMVDGILHQCGGHILVETAQGMGSTFRLLLQPALTDVVDVAANRPVSVVQANENKCILVIDDEVGISSFLTELLSGAGYQVRAFNDALAALEAFKSAPDSIDLVITDQTMPGLTGVELVQELLSLRPKLPVILCTGYSESVDEASAQQLGISVFLKKPVVTDELLGAIATLLTR